LACVPANCQTAGKLSADENHPIFAHRVELPLREGSYKWAGGKAVSVFNSMIVGVETDGGVVGFGEVCPLRPFYLLPPRNKNGR